MNPYIFPTPPEPQPWVMDALCRGSHDPDLWFPGGSHDYHNGRVDAAIRTCMECPVRQQCLDLAMEAEEGQHFKTRAGVFGGLTPTQRWEKARDAAGRKPCNVCGTLFKPRNGASLYCGRECRRAMRLKASREYEARRRAAA